MQSRSVELLGQGSFLRLKRQGIWEYVERTRATSAVVIVAVTPEDRLLLVEQYRPSVAGLVLELPAGLVGDECEGETVEAAAQRELCEETGYVADEFEHLLRGPISAGLSNEMIDVVRAIRPRRVGLGGGVGDERITVREVGIQNAGTWLGEQKVLVDPKVYLGLYLARFFRPDNPR